jgi:prepilin-type N-terminal cleavage/methylation domain-containing protein
MTWLKMKISDPKSRFRQFFDKSGMTLVEVIVSAAIIAIVAVIMAQAFLTATNVMSKGDVYTRAGEAMDAAIANGSATEQGGTADKLQLKDGSIDVTINSKIYDYTVPGSGITYHIIGQ